MASAMDQHTEYRRAHLGGAVYLGIEGLLWLLAAVLGAAGREPIAVVVLLFGGMAIHPLATGCSRLLGLPSVDAANRLPILNTWVALTIPLGLPLIFMATAGGRGDLFFPAFAVLVGAHFLPFAHIYAMRSYLALAAALVAAGIVFGFVLTAGFAACGFVAGGVLVVFSVVHFGLVRREIGAGEPSRI